MNGSSKFHPLAICLISQEFPPYTSWGGIGTYNATIAFEYARRGHRVTVISRAHSGAPGKLQPADGIVVHRVGVPIERKRFVGRTIDRILYARTVAAAVRSVDAQEQFDVIEATEASLEGEILVYDEVFAPRMVIQCHGSNAFGQAASGLLAPLHRIDWAWSYAREQRVLAKAPRIIVPSAATRNVVTSQGVRPGKLRLIYEGIDTSRFIPPLTRNLATRLSVGFVGRLEPRKGIDFIWRVIEALGADTGIEFHLKGAIHPAARSAIQQRLTRHASVVMHHLPSGHEEMPAFYQTLDVLLQPSYFENFGLAYAEAMATGLLVIAGKGGSACEVIRENETGLLVDPDGPVDNVLTVLQRLAADRTAFDTMRLAARVDVERRFSLNTCVEAKLALYQEVAR